MKLHRYPPTMTRRLPLEFRFQRPERFHVRLHYKRLRRAGMSPLMARLAIIDLLRAGEWSGKWSQ